MKKKSGSKLIVESLENEGVEYVFGIPGEQTTPLMEQLRKSDIEFVATRHEQGAAFMADVYSRICGSVGVCLSTLGPGATNLVTGVGNANFDNSSVVALTSQRETKDKHKHTHQLVDTNTVFTAITKRTDTVRRAETIPEQVRKSFEIAKRERRGATHLELPLDVTTEYASVEQLDTSQNKVSPDGVQPKNVKQAIKMIDEANSPIVIAGNGIISQNASEEFTNYIDYTNLPVVTTFMGKGAISHENEHHVGVVGFGSNDYPMDAVRQADLIVTVGYDYIEFHPESWNVGKEKTLIHVDNTEPEVDKSYGAELTLVANIRRIIEQLIRRTESPISSESYVKELRDSYMESRNEEYAENESAPFTPQQVVAALRSATERHDTVISDVGAHKYWLSRRYPTYEPNTYIVSNGFASMGIALPGAVSADLVTEKNTIAVTGDGGMLMNMQELETISRLDSSPTIVVLEDNEYTAITMEQQNDYKQNYGASFNNPDFVKLADSFGFNGYRITEKDELEETLRDAVAEDVTTIVSIPISPIESYKLEANNN